MTMSGSKHRKNEGFLGSYLSKGLKTNQLELNTDEKTLRPIARLREPRDLFALPKSKNNDFALQAPRWPIECQVLDERVTHIPHMHGRSEPFNIPGGLKPRPVGEENGTVVFNYNPISAVNYVSEKKPKLKRRESSDSDISSSESRASSPERNESTLNVKNSFSKLINALNLRSSSNSNDDEDEYEDVFKAVDDGDAPTSTLQMSETGSDDTTTTVNDNDNNGISAYAEVTSEGTNVATQTSDDMDDIWANNSPEYNPATPIFSKKPSVVEMKFTAATMRTFYERTGREILTSYNDDEDRGDNNEGGDSRERSPSEADTVTDANSELVTALTKETITYADKWTGTEPEEATGAEEETTSGAYASWETEFEDPKPEASLELHKMNKDVLKLYNDIMAFTEANRPQPSVSEVNSRMYLDLNAEPSECESLDFAQFMDSALNDIDSPEANTDPLSPPQFSRSAIGGSRILTDCHPCRGTDYDGLEFESRFESGNLAKAVRITRTYYELYLRPDLYTNRSKQWFYFRVQNTRKDVMYRFSIVNLVKSDSLYNEGMRPLMYSKIRAKQVREGWRRCGENICYYRNDDGNPNPEEEDDSTYTLTFNIEFPHDDDTVYLAHSYPYTYSDLQDYLMAIQKHPAKSKYCKLRILCRTLAGNNVYYLTVTAPQKHEEAGNPKKCVVVSARVHPSETPASWMMKGLMDYITGETWIAKRLRQKFVFKLIPMLNPDGVIVGNTRNSLTGRDLNRQYRTVIRETYPSIWYTKALIKRLIEECGVALYCDMHAHSRKQNIFLYGCENKRNPEKRLTEQVFPLMMHKNSSDTFSFEGCKFKVQRNKEGTGRIVVWMLGITNSYTIEASFGGSSLGGRRGTHFNVLDYENVGRTFCETLLDYYDDHPSKVKKQEKAFKLVKKIRRREKREKKVLKIKKLADQGCIINEKIKAKRSEKSVS